MNDDAPFQLDRALFERWRSHDSIPAEPPAALDPMLLAAYLDGRLSERDAEPLEELLAADPSALDHLIDGKTHPIGPEIASAAFLRNAQALLPPDGATATILPFTPRPATRRITAWAAWGAIAASLVLISLVGFNVGMQTERNINEPAGIGTSIDILDQSNAALGDGVG